MRPWDAVAVAAGLSLLALASWAAWHHRLEQLPGQPALPVAFEHFDHREVQCVECHHNFVDDTGGGACYNCHKMDPEIGVEIEAMFHQFCRDCHLQKRLDGEDSGPLRQCSLCHRYSGENIILGIK